MAAQAKGSPVVSFVAAVIAVVIVFLMIRAHKVSREPKVCTTQQASEANCKEKK